MTVILRRMIAQLSCAVLQSFGVFFRFPVAFSPGPAKTDGVINRDVIDKAEYKNSFFMVRWLIILIFKKIKYPEH